MKVVLKALWPVSFLVVLAILILGMRPYFISENHNEDGKSSGPLNPIASSSDATNKSYGLTEDVADVDSDFNSYLEGRTMNVGQAQLQIAATQTINLLPLEDSLNAASSSYFSIEGQPKFLRSDPPDKGEIIKTNQSGNLSLEIMSSEPDTFLYLWDLSQKKLYNVGQCGTVCYFSGAFWLNDQGFVAYGWTKAQIEEGANEKWQRFVYIYDLPKLTMTAYSDK